MRYKLLHPSCLSIAQPNGYRAFSEQGSCVENYCTRVSLQKDKPDGARSLLKLEQVCTEITNTKRNGVYSRIYTFHTSCKNINFQTIFKKT